jgi:4-amino-4-deoxy-L-arabinose transferase-like glycosyltransferase
LTAGIDRKFFAEMGFELGSRRLVYLALLVIFIAGFGVRFAGLDVESLAEDELNKLQAVEEYRSTGLSGRNGEHPFLMKGLQTGCIILAEKWNEAFPAKMIAEETALRLPSVLFGSLVIFTLFILVDLLFGSLPGLVSSILYAFDPNAIGFDRMAKEETFLLFFFLLGNAFLVKAQTAAERGLANESLRYHLLTGAALGGMLASKYAPHMLVVPVAYHALFHGMQGKRWNISLRLWIGIGLVMAAAFVVLNPTIVLPETWTQMVTFLTEKRIGHDAYEYAGELYPNQMTRWLSGVPASFYFVFVLVKTPLITLSLFAVGVVVFFRERLGDGKYFVAFWALFWFVPFAVLGGKFTRYYALGLPVILVVSALGLCGLCRLFAGFAPRRIVFPAAIGILALASSWTAFSAGPHFRLFINAVAGSGAAGSYFPHDEFYDLDTKEAVTLMLPQTGPGVRVFSETPYLYAHYFERAGRDVRTVSLSESEHLASAQDGDLVVIARGRRYFSNDAIIKYLLTKAPFARTEVNSIESTRIYRLTDEDARMLSSVSER